MKLFGLGADRPSPEELARQQASIESIQAGGLPLNAIDRLKEQAQMWLHAARASDGQQRLQHGLAVHDGRDGSI